MTEARGAAHCTSGQRRGLYGPNDGIAGMPGAARFRQLQLNHGAHVFTMRDRMLEMGPQRRVAGRRIWRKFDLGAGGTGDDMVPGPDAFVLGNCALIPGAGGAVTVAACRPT